MLANSTRLKNTCPSVLVVRDPKNDDLRLGSFLIATCALNFPSMRRQFRCQCFHRFSIKSAQLSTSDYKVYGLKDIGLKEYSKDSHVYCQRR